MHRVLFPWTTLYAYTGSGDKKFVPVTPWVSATEAAKARVDVSLANSHTDFRCAWGYQVADHDDETPSSVEKGATLSGDGKKVGSFLAINTDTDAKALIRFGFVVWSAAGSPTLICARAMGEVIFVRV